MAVNRGVVPRVFKERIRVFIVGGGSACKLLLTAIRDDPFIEVLGLAEINLDAEAIPIATSMGIPIYRDYREVFDLPEVDLVLNLTGEKEIGDELSAHMGGGAEVMGALGGRLLWSALSWKEYLATTDYLTGLYNAGVFHRTLRSEVERGIRYSAMFSIFFMDMDNLKEVNDAYGHVVGDKVLRRVAKAMRSSIRGSDVACRYGGDEFAMILPDTPPDGAIKVAERIRRRIESIWKEGFPRVTVSIGVAAFPIDGVTSEELVRRADWGMYQAKRTGGNRVCYAGDEVSIPPICRSVKDALSFVSERGERDKYNRLHSEVVAKVSVEIGKALKLSRSEIRMIETAGILHDIGKSEFFPDAASWSYKEHPVIGAFMIRNIPALSKARPMILFHHERFDGTGFPKGLKGEEIPFGARVIHLADRLCRLLQDEGHWSVGRVTKVLEIIGKDQEAVDPHLLAVFLRSLKGRDPQEPLIE